MSDVLIEVLHDPIGRWFLYVGVALAAFGLIGYLVLTVRKRLRQMADDLGLVKHEVKNNHTTNLREEADDRHDENRGTLARIERKVDAALVQLGVHEWRLSELDATVENTRDRRPDAH